VYAWHVAKLIECIPEFLYREGEEGASSSSFQRDTAECALIALLNCSSHGTCSCAPVQYLTSIKPATSRLPLFPPHQCLSIRTKYAARLHRCFRSWDRTGFSSQTTNESGICPCDSPPSSRVTVQYRSGTQTWPGSHWLTNGYALQPACEEQNRDAIARAEGLSMALEVLRDGDEAEDLQKLREDCALESALALVNSFAHSERTIYTAFSSYAN
jgi:hypothetical protein